MAEPQKLGSSRDIPGRLREYETIYVLRPDTTNEGIAQANQRVRKIIDDAGSAVPRDHALMRLASTFEEAQRTPEALQAYRKLIDEFPSSVYVSDAKRRFPCLLCN